MASSEEGAEKMQFILEQGGRCGPRIGKLVWTATTTSAMATPLATPTCLLYSRGGAVPNLTRDLEDDVMTGHVPAAVMLTMPTMYNNGHHVLSADLLSQYEKGIHAFLNRQSQLLYLSVQDPATPANYKFNEVKTVSVWTKSGRSKVGVADHIQLLKSCRPNLFECLYDSAPSRENKMKRIGKSVDRTLQFLDETIAAIQEHKELKGCSLLGAIVGSAVLSERLRSAKQTAERPTDGFVHEGFDSEEFSSDTLDEIITSVNQCLPEDKPRFVHGIYRPEDIFLAVESGVDVFETSYTHIAAEKGCAVVFPRGERSPTSSSSPSPSSPNSSETDGSMRLKYESSRPFEIDLTKERYESDFSPFLPGCPCYACRHHTRAYTHHLLNTKEILAKILLTMHNLTHYMSFFASLRDSLHKSTFHKFKDQCLHNT